MTRAPAPEAAIAGRAARRAVLLLLALLLALLLTMATMMEEKGWQGRTAAMLLAFGWTRLGPKAASPPHPASQPHPRSDAPRHRSCQDAARAPAAGSAGKASPGALAACLRLGAHQVWSGTRLAQAAVAVAVAVAVIAVAVVATRRRAPAPAAPAASPQCLVATEPRRPALAHRLSRIVPGVAAGGHMAGRTVPRPARRLRRGDSWAGASGARSAVHLRLSRPPYVPPLWAHVCRRLPSRPTPPLPPFPPAGPRRRDAGARTTHGAPASTAAP